MKMTRMMAILSVVLLFAAMATGVAQAAILFSEDFEAAGTTLGGFGYAIHAGTGDPAVGTGTNLSTRVVTLGPSNSFADISLGGTLTGDLTYTADAYTTGTTDTFFGIGKVPGPFGNAGGIFLGYAAGSWILDSRGVGGTFASIPGSGGKTGGAVVVQMLTDIGTNTVTANVTDGGGTATLNVVVGSLATAVEDLGTISFGGYDNATGFTIEVDNVVLTGTFAVIPEPSALVLLSLGMVGLLGYRRRK